MRDLGRRRKCRRVRNTLERDRSDAQGERRQRKSRDARHGQELVVDLSRALE